MDQERQEAENTDLIDVSDIEPNFDDDLETERGRRKRRAEMPGMQGAAQASGPTIAALKDRFAALAIDACFLFTLYWFMMIAYRAIAVGQAAGPIPAAGMGGLLFHGLFLLIALLWFIVPEMAFGGSAGKLLCHLTVRRIDGSYPTFAGVLIRNLLRPVDLALFPLFVTAALLEWGSWHQRLGDLAGRTLVLRKLGSPPRQYALSLDIVATACGRAIAFAIDAALFAAFAFGWALLLSPESPLFSMLLVALSPVAALLFFVLPEWLTKTSPGKWVLGYAICLEDGSAIDLPSALVRSLWRLLDTNLFGFLTCLFSLRRQRPGDAAAGSVVVGAPREWRGLIGLGSILILSLIFLSSGLHNRDNFLHEGFEINFLPSIDFSGKLVPRETTSANLMTLNFRFAAGDPGSVRRPAICQPGEMLYIVFETSGFKRQEGKVWLQEDLTVRYPDDSVGLKLENINDFNQELTQPGPIRFENTIAIPEGALPGRYTAVIALRDKLANQELKEQRFFYVTPPEEKGAAAAKAEGGPPEALPPPPPSAPAVTAPPPPAAPETAPLLQQGRTLTPAPPSGAPE